MKKINNGIVVRNKKKRIRTHGEKENSKYLGMLEADTIKQVEIKKRKKSFLEDRENSKPNTAAGISLKNNHLDCPSCKILGTILDD